jgi:hypothetical protein
MNDQTLLLRQVHPNFFHNGVVSSQAFSPSPKDVGKLSVYDGDQISPEASHQHYTKNLGLESVGVWAVKGGEVVSTGLTHQPDPTEKNPAHAVIDFGSRTDKQCRRLAKLLKKFALERGSLYRTT